MPIKITMPALSPTMEEGTLAKWLVSEGDEVNAGDVIAEIETDKATMEVEAVDEGKIGKIVVEAGTENVKVNDVIAVLLEEGESNSDINLDEVKNSTASEQNNQDDEDEGDNKDSAPQPQQNVAQAEGKEIKDRDILYAQGKLIEPPVFDEAKFFEDTTEKTVREALRDAMADEMRADESIYLMGEEVAEYNGAYRSPRLAR